MGFKSFYEPRFFKPFFRNLFPPFLFLSTSSGDFGDGGYCLSFPPPEEVLPSEDVSRGFFPPQGLPGEGGSAVESSSGFVFPPLFVIFLYFFRTRVGQQLSLCPPGGPQGGFKIIVLKFFREFLGVGIVFPLLP